MDDNPINLEFDLLASIFCLEDESCDFKTMFPNHVISVIQRVCDVDEDDRSRPKHSDDDHDQLANVSTAAVTLCLKFEILPDYPLVVPSVSVHCSHKQFTRNLALKVKDFIREEALSLIGTHKLLFYLSSSKMG